MVLEDDLVAGDLRLLTVDNSLFLPIKMQIRVLVSSSDVLHS
jgi:heme/copper-type cytochrome/quinol oxidase subunit 2